jgi:hypothetical protein
MPATIAPFSWNSEYPPSVSASATRHPNAVP